MQGYTLHHILIKAGIHELPQIKHMYIHTLQGIEKFSWPGITVIELPNKQIIEIYTDVADIPNYLFANQSIVLGFTTPSIEQTYEACISMGCTVLSDIQEAGKCYRYFHYRLHQVVYMMCEILY